MRPAGRFHDVAGPNGRARTCRDRPAFAAYPHIAFQRIQRGDNPARTGDYVPVSRQPEHQQQAGGRRQRGAPEYACRTASSCPLRVNRASPPGDLVPCRDTHNLLLRRLVELGHDGPHDSLVLRKRSQPRGQGLVYKHLIGQHFLQLPVGCQPFLQRLAIPVVQLRAYVRIQFVLTDHPVISRAQLASPYSP